MKKELLTSLLARAKSVLEHYNLFYTEQEYEHSTLLHTYYMDTCYFIHIAGTITIVMINATINMVVENVTIDQFNDMFNIDNI